MTITTRRRGLAQFEATVRELSEAAAKGRARTVSLRGTTTDLSRDPEVLQMAIEELRVHQEELEVAEEQLRAQLDELALCASHAQAERDHYRVLFDAAPDGFFVTDRLAVIRDLNLAGAKMLGVDARFLVGKPLATLVDLADSRLFRDGIDRLRTTSTIELELRLRPRGGEPAWHSLRASCIEDGTALLWIAQATRAGCAVETPLGPSHEELYGPTSDRLAVLERGNRDKTELLERERRLREDLAAADVAKDRFIGVLSHDLRAPLNAVLGWTQLLRREPLDHAARDRALALIERNAQTQIRLVEELLDISRVASNRRQLERTTLDLSELVRRGVTVVLPIARERGLELDSVVTEGVVVFGDRARLDQVLANLLSNALKVTPRGGRIIVVLKRDGQHARLTVQDTGRGIAPEVVPFVFDPFRQAADDTAPDGGLGFGLYIARRAVELHDGTISVESGGVDQGARLIVLLPIVTSTSVSGRPLPPPSDPAPATAQVLHGVRVLVVDADDDRRELMASILHLHGGLVTTATDAATALLAFDASPSDVVVTDLTMTDREGLDLVHALRARPELTTAVVAVSGHAAPEDVDLALKAGFDVHLAKPVGPAELVAAVAEAARGLRR